MKNWNDYPTFEATPMPRPRAELTRHTDGTWHIRHPDALQRFNPATAKHHPICWLDALASKAHLSSPMICQRDLTSAGAPWRSISWSQMWHSAQTLGSWLVAQGYSQATPIATLSGNSIELAGVRFAAMMANVPLVHISPAYSLSSKDFAHLRSIFTLTQPKAIFVQTAKPFSQALTFIESLGHACTVLDASSEHWASLNAQPIDTALLATAQYQAEDTCAVYFTSGSTGAPKGVAISHGMLSAQLMMVRTLYEPETRGPITALDWLPWHHVFAGISTLSRLMILGGTYYIDDGRPLAGQFDATLRNLRELAPSFYSSTPLAFSKLIPALEAEPELAKHFFSKLEFLGYGGASLPRESWERMQHLAIQYRGCKIAFLSGFGTTESASTGLALYWPSDDTAVIGLPYPGVEIKLVPLQDDATGRYEMRMRGPHMFRGYLGRPDLNTQVFDEDGYYKLGDAVRFANLDNILCGLRFAGRVAENFKLASGTWVNAGALRMQAITLLSPYVTDCIVCGRDLSDITVLAWPNETALRAIHPDLASMPLESLVKHIKVVTAIAAKLRSAADTGNATTVQRAALLAVPPMLDAGEITDKGYVNQNIATQTRAADIAHLYAAPCPAHVAQR